MASYDYRDPIRTYDIAKLAAKHQNATHRYGPVPQDMRDRWMAGQDNELLFWVPLEHRQVLCLPHVETIWIWGWPKKLDLFNFKFGIEWTEFIDQEWLKELDGRGKRVWRLLG